MSGTAADAAAWMMEHLKKVHYLQQEVAAGEIARRFGEEFVYVNDNGGLAIDRAVLKEFRKLNDKTVVWEGSEQQWRYREPYDEPGRRV
jgi:hypothetical protein